MPLHATCTRASSARRCRLASLLGLMATLLLPAASFAADPAANVFVRFKAIAPADLHYSLTIPGVGALGSAGLKEKVDRLPTAGEAELLKTGQESAWVQVPPSPRQPNSYSGTQYGFTQISVFADKGKPLPPDTVIGMEFSTSPAKDGVFHTVEEPVELVKPVWSAETSGVLAVYIPTDLSPEGRKRLQTITELANHRLKVLQEMKLTDPPHLTRLRVGTWMNVAVTGRLNKARAETEFQIAELLGINSMTASMDFGYAFWDADFAELAAKHGVIATTWTTWGGKEWLAQFAKPAPAAAPPAAPAGADAPRPVSFEEANRAGAEAQYAQQAELARAAFPKSFNYFKHINVGDEPSQPFSAAIISDPKNSGLLAAFREVLKTQRVDPKALGVASLDAVMPLEDRAKVNSPETTRLFYHTKRALDQLAIQAWRPATEAIRKHFPQADFVGVNYQAGPAQYAFIGNTNDVPGGYLDIFELSRQGAFHGVMTEDWTAGWDLGCGQICLASDMLRAAGRKLNLPLASYVVGGENISGETFSYLMEGVKENLLYLYGPYTNIGPVWADNEAALRSCAEVTRTIKKAEGPIADGHVRPSRAALLLASTSDIMQVKGAYFFPERQFIYIALKHSYVPLDVICEQDVADDNLLDQYGLLYVTDPQVRTDVQKKIADWVNKGGRLWLGPAAASWDEYNQPSNVLTPVLGLKTRGVTFQTPWPAPLAVPWATTVEKAKYSSMGTLKAASPLFGGNVNLPVSGMKIDVTPGTAQVLGTYDDGKPAVLLNRFGQGEAMLVGAMVGQEYALAHYAKMPGTKEFSFDAGADARKLATALLDSAKVERAVNLSVPGIYTSVWDAPQGTLVFLLNMGGVPVQPDVTVRVPDAGKVKSVETTGHGPLKFETHGNEIRFSLPLASIEIVWLKP